MSPVNKPPHILTAIGLAITMVIMFAASSATAQQQNCPKITVSCPESIEPGEKLTCSANLSFRAATTVPRYLWSVSSGRITQGQGTSSITVSTAGVTAKRLRVRLRLPQFGQDCADSAVVIFKGDDVVITPPPDTKPEPVCPEIKMACPESVTKGKEISCSVNLSGGTKDAKPRYSWSVSAGTITQGQGTSAISVSTAQVSEKTLTIRLNLGGFGRRCPDRSIVKLRDDSTPTPTPTPSPTPATPSPTSPTPGHTSPTPSPTSPTPPATPTASPTETQTPTVGGIGTTSPSPSPTASEKLSPGPSVLPASTNLWPWILAGLVALAAAAFFGIRHLFQSGGFLSAGIHKDMPPWSGGDVPRDDELLPLGPEPPLQGSHEVAERHQRLDALIAGAKRKQDDEVTCTVFAPHEAGRGDGFLVQALAHLPDQTPLLQDIAMRADQAAAERGAATLGSIERGQELGFYLQMPGLEIDEPQQSVIWMGEITPATFGVTVPENFKARSINCKLSVSRQNVPIGHVRFNFKISDAEQPKAIDAQLRRLYDPTLEPHADFVRYRLAFISYASADRSEVMKRVQMLDMAKIRYFQDLLSLEAGKQWEPLIYRYIDECDVFYLFWSSAAKKSKWVEKEVQRALNRKGDNLEAPPEIMPIPIEGPPPVEPPSYLADIHFDSKFLYFINSQESA